VAPSAQARNRQNAHGSQRSIYHLPARRWQQSIFGRWLDKGIPHAACKYDLDGASSAWKPWCLWKAADGGGQRPCWGEFGVQTCTSDRRRPLPQQRRGPRAFTGTHRYGRNTARSFSAMSRRIVQLQYASQRDMFASWWRGKLELSRRTPPIGQVLSFTNGRFQVGCLAANEESSIDLSAAPVCLL